MLAQLIRALANALTTVTPTPPIRRKTKGGAPRSPGRVWGHKPQRGPQGPRTRMSGGSISIQKPSERTFVAYHGTPAVTSARSILRHGWMVGSGNAHGDGIYLSIGIQTAKGYAGSAGVYLKCRVSGKASAWTPRMQGEFDRWCKSRMVRQDSSAKTSFLIQRGIELLQAADVLVVLAPQFANPTAWKRRARQIRIMGVYRASDDKPIRV